MDGWMGWGWLVYNDSSLECCVAEVVREDSATRTTGSKRDTQREATGRHSHAGPAASPPPRTSAAATSRSAWSRTPVGCLCWGRFIPDVMLRTPRMGRWMESRTASNGMNHLTSLKILISSVLCVRNVLQNLGKVLNSLKSCCCLLKYFMILVWLILKLHIMNLIVAYDALVRGRRKN